MSYFLISLVVYLFLVNKTLGWVTPRFGLSFSRPKVQHLKPLAAIDWTALTHASMDDPEQKKAFETLDYITCPEDVNDPLYDVNKDVKRDELLAFHTYSGLKLVLREKGLDTSGDKLEMLTRLMLHTIDPSIEYHQL